MLFVVVTIVGSNTAKATSKNDLSSVVAQETVRKRHWVFFGCGEGGSYCGGQNHCHSVIMSSQRCAGWHRGDK